MNDSQFLKKKPRKFKNINKLKKTPKEPEQELKLNPLLKFLFLSKGKKNSSNYYIKHKSTEEKKQTFFSKYKYDLLLTPIPFIILFVLLIARDLNLKVVEKIEKNRLMSLSYEVKLSPYPFIKNFTVPDISAQAAIIMLANSRTVLYSKNPTLRFSMASTAKIMTGLVALDYFQENSIINIYTPVVEGSYLGFQQGEQFYLKDLLYAMFLPSSNEAAYAIAQNYPGGVDAFIKKMNEKAQELGLSNTHFNDPAGLDDENNYSTVLDMSHLAYAALKNTTLAQIFATKKKTIFDTTGRRQFPLENLNKLLGVDGVNGIKTGTTEGAGEVLITSKVENERTFIVVVMKSIQRYTDTKTLLSLLFNNISYITPKFTLSGN